MEYQMAEGKVKWFNNAKGYGFINPNIGSDDYFVHFSSVHMDGYKSLKAGQPVCFELLETDKGAHAVNVHLLTNADEEGVSENRAEMA